MDRPLSLENHEKRVLNVFDGTLSYGSEVRDGQWADGRKAKDESMR